MKVVSEKAMLPENTRKPPDDSVDIRLLGDDLTKMETNQMETCNKPQ